MPRHRVAGQLARSVLPLELRRVRDRAGARVRVRVRVKVRVSVRVRVRVRVWVRVGMGTVPRAMHATRGLSTPS